MELNINKEIWSESSLASSSTFHLFIAYFQKLPGKQPPRECENVINWTYISVCPPPRECENVLAANRVPMKKRLLLKIVLQSME